MTARTSLRKDAAQNRAHILAVGRRFLDDDSPLQLSEVARAAEVGVATVYRHFPTAHALLEAIARPTMEDLAETAARTLDDADTWRALSGFLEAGLRAQLEDPSLLPVLSSDEVGAETAELRAVLTGTLETLVSRARDAGLLAPTLRGFDVFPLMCGIAYAGRLAMGHSPQDVDAPYRYLEILLSGMRRG